MFGKQSNLLIQSNNEAILQLQIQVSDLQKELQREKSYRLWDTLQEGAEVYDRTGNKFIVVAVNTGKKPGYILSPVRGNPDGIQWTYNTLSGYYITIQNGWRVQYVPSATVAVNEGATIFKSLEKLTQFCRDEHYRTIL